MKKKIEQEERKEQAKKKKKNKRKKGQRTKKNSPFFWCGKWCDVSISILLIIGFL